jgi:hypothetical protein
MSNEIKNLTELERYLPKKVSSVDLTKVASALLDKYRSQILPVPRIKLSESLSERIITSMLDRNALNRIKRKYGN